MVYQPHSGGGDYLQLGTDNVWLAAVGSAAFPWRIAFAFSAAIEWPTGIDGIKLVPSTTTGTELTA
ncbi:hypothetical protein, partial [Sphingomonas sp. 10B4]|uniref:hypothetical protein n=1 Tax=Sphingomonas sp. 10B4 TaxID=3048575 RepID=UPI002B227EA1